MAHTESAKKNYRKMLKRRERNVAASSRIKSTTKKLLAAVEKGDLAGAQKLLPEAMKAIDKAAKAAVIHDNTASNKKSRLSRSINRLQAAQKK
ncbi:MAG: 30S ribosomal protein S20 [Planctomycetes bacterium]|nr:30S ribosomal protein S20 [Planctomycetota bacterium]